MREKRKIMLIIGLLIILNISIATSLSAKEANYQLSEDIKDENATIIGEVKVAMTCIPTPLSGAKVTAVRMIPLGWLFARYQTTTDSNGEYQLELNPGLYRIFVRAEGYIQYSPFLWQIIRVESGQIYNCSFMMKSGGLPF